MGVSKLWDILEPVKEDIKLPELRGLTVAVDLSVWIVQSVTVQTTVESPYYIMLRNVLYRIADLLKNGIKPVFIIDGKAPEIKSTALAKRQKQLGNSGSSSTERAKFSNSSQKCKELIEALGLPCIVHEGEGEQLCAWLNASGKVDGCFTDDGDCFLYGAETVFKNYSMEKGNKDSTIERYKLENIENKLGMTRRDLIAYALLSGCDYGEAGVQGVGPKKTMSFMETLHTHKDVLTRILSWRENEEIQKWKSLQSDLKNTQKSKHCKTCDHTGSVAVHKKSGCSMCETSTDCGSASLAIACSCDWHKLSNQIKPHLKEVDLYDKAVKDPTFPDKKIVDEFLKEDNGESDKKLIWSLPDLKCLAGVLKENLNMDTNAMMKVVIPAVVYQGLYNILPSYTSIVTPIQIIRSCKDNFIHCYEVKWKIQKDFMEDSLPERLIKIEKTLFKSKFPELVEQFEKQEEEKKSSKRKGKRKNREVDPTQTRMKDFFKAKKESKFDEGSSKS